MARRTAQKDITEANERKAWDMRMEGRTQERIAVALGITQQAVCKMLARLNARHAAAFSSKAEDIRNDHTARLEALLAEALEAWRDSRQDAESSQTVTKSTALSKEKQEAQPHGGSLSRSEKQPLFDPEDIPNLYTDEEGEEVPAEVRAARIAERAMMEATAALPLLVVEQTTTSATKGQAGDPRHLDNARKILSDIRNIWGADAPKKQEISGPNGGPIALTDGAKQKAAEELSAWRRGMNDELSNMPNAPLTPPISSTITES